MPLCHEENPIFAKDLATSQKFVGHFKNCSLIRNLIARVKTLTCVPKVCTPLESASTSWSCSFQILRLDRSQPLGFGKQIGVLDFVKIMKSTYNSTKLISFPHWQLSVKHHCKIVGPFRQSPKKNRWPNKRKTELLADTNMTRNWLSRWHKCRICRTPRSGIPLFDSFISLWFVIQKIFGNSNNVVDPFSISLLSDIVLIDTGLQPTVMNLMVN